MVIPPLRDDYLASGSGVSIKGYPYHWRWKYATTRNPHSSIGLRRRRCGTSSMAQAVSEEPLAGAFFLLGLRGGSSSEGRPLLPSSVRGPRSKTPPKTPHSPLPPS